ncbi:hypothetical protein CDD81_2529 [Ophiocordyceps australis]|uniref:Carrier domain-containing protein n=1 Tax=Ophiocordyceps australis TaxID=1399860 RepID=A0A2C5Y7G0_9HYPO|nr:hypothetical protein CDD81_2529 [Ophiocordyceps australis]
MDTLVERLAMTDTTADGGFQDEKQELENGEGQDKDETQAMKNGMEQGEHDKQDKESGKEEGEPDERQSISAADLEQIWQWNKTVPETIEACIHERILERARRHPLAEAVRAWDGRLTYGELDDYSGRLARVLGRHMARGANGTGPDDARVHDTEANGSSILCVPLCFEKSVWTVVAVLGVLRSGAAFSLTDASQPEARLRCIVEQTHARIVVTSVAQGDLGRRICPHGTVICLSRGMLDQQEQEQEQGQGQVQHYEAAAAWPASPMYIIFTSGSTGRPKGVVVSHQNYLSGAVPRAQAVGYNEASAVFDFPSYAFDVSIDCMLCTLAGGGVVCVPSDEDRVNRLSEAIRSSGANMVHMTPSVARLLDADIMPSLRVLGLGGEAVSASDAAAWSRHTRLVIAYGPSECTVACTVNWELSRSRGIGVGVGGVTWIVDAQCHDVLMPIGAVGELLIEGPVVAMGYLDEPEQTSQVFIEAPGWLAAGHEGVAAGRGGRLYKTGDLVRYEAKGGGMLEFVGRKDQQVKLRGQRVELAEVEHHVRACLPAGTRVAAEVIESGRGRVATLVAFVCEGHEADQGNEGVVEASRELRAALAALDSAMGSRAPRYMVPAACLTLGRMPSLVSGKTDRRRLREIGEAICRSRLLEGGHEGHEGQEEEEAQTEKEKLLVQAWTQVLGNDKRGLFRQSNFFALGGDSLRAMKLVSAARRLGLSLSVGEVFTTPTLAGMAQASSTAAAGADEDDIAPFSLLAKDWPADEARQQTAALCGLPSDAVQDVYACTPLQEALMALSAKVAEAYVAQRLVELCDAATAERLGAAVQQAQRQSSILRTRIVQVPGRGLFQVVVGAAWAWHLDSGRSLDDYLATDRARRMELGQPLARFAVVQGARPSFVVTMHHSLYDGWCMPLIVDSINRAFVHGQPRVRAADMRHFMRYLASRDQAASQDFWRRRLQGATGLQFPLLPWHGYQPRADSLLEEYVALDAGGGATTLAATIRAAWTLVAARYTANPHVVFGETLTGRNAPIAAADEIEGPLITTVPVHVVVDAEASLDAFVHALQRQTVAQMAHEHMGLQNIRRLSSDAREACQLGTGLVLQPSTHRAAPDALPASRLVPASDDEAAREALKFNTYAVMLVCSMDAHGFLVMASFDAKTVHADLMQRVLGQLKTVARLVHSGRCGSMRVGDVVRATAADLTLLEAYAAAPRAHGLACVPRQGVEALHVVDPADASVLQPVGAVGELVVQAANPLPLTELARRPSWLKASSSSSDSRLFCTGQLVRYNGEGRLQPVEHAQEQQPAPSSQRLSAASHKQRRLGRLWSRVLDIAQDDIGLDDSFFLLGGDSISAMKLVAEARLEGIGLTVMQIFETRRLFDMAQAMQEQQQQHDEAAQHDEAVGLSLLAVDDADAFVRDVVQPQLLEPGITIEHVLPARPLQHVAVQGTVQEPRFAVRYELMFFDAPVDAARLARACQALVDAHEILRTLFVQHEAQCLAVATRGLRVRFEEHCVDCDAQLDEYARHWCRLNVRSSMPHGSAFVAWLLVRARLGRRACLVWRISHAQYDELCLPVMLRHLSALYQGDDDAAARAAIPPATPFSSYVAHVLRHAIPASTPYWRRLLAGSSLSILRPPEPVTRTAHFAIQTTLDISSCPLDVTPATLPTASWALCLARRLATRDVVFGEVVSGRNISSPSPHAVVGPCWQYIPVRVCFQPTWRACDLLAHVQRQHVASAAHEAMAFAEIVSRCTDWDAESTPRWFDSVVHQDVAHVTSLPFAACERMETLYPHQEPLDEWKIQAYIDAGAMTLEIVTVESWGEYAKGLLDDLAAAVRVLLDNGAAPLCLD